MIARNSSFAYKGKSIDLRTVGHQLGVRHVLEGSVRKAGQRVRINAQLVDTATLGHVWAERFDADYDDIFALQDNITAKIVAVLQVSLKTGERERKAHIPTTDMEAYDLYLRGRALRYPPSKQSFARARVLLEKARLRDDDFAEVYAELGYLYVLDWAFGWTDEPGREQAAKKSVAVNDTLAVTHERLGWIIGIIGDYDEAVAHLKRAIALDPSDADAYHWLGETLNLMGDPEKALELSKEAMRLSPNIHGGHRGHSNLLLGRHDDAIATLTESITRAPGFPVNYIYLAIAYSELDQTDEAREAISDLLGLIPRCTLEFLRQRFPQYRNPADTDRFVEGLRKAGLPER